MTISGPARRASSPSGTSGPRASAPRVPNPTPPGPTPPGPTAPGPLAPGLRAQAPLAPASRADEPRSVLPAPEVLDASTAHTPLVIPAVRELRDRNHRGAAREIVGIPTKNCG
ncbi:hypothetical protein GCM10010497_55530 [Streptomyces cinereoruber]|uniref:Uncharacterized protein n=1 Tax=Streptomyces cinereoruber TaxID=67260 RepID=A0AAV4KTH9_9ACTN|nr:hypothetical protein GCM10010497_55530 [Streptomyces cinereoruber]